MPERNIPKFVRPAIALGIALTLAASALPFSAHAERYDDGSYYGPPVGADISRDYLSGDYSIYHGTPRKDRRVDEQLGWRDGVLHTPPYWYWGRCGCSRLYYGGRWYNRPVALYDYGERAYGKVELEDRGADYRWPRRPY